LEKFTVLPVSGGARVQDRKSGGLDGGNDALLASKQECVRAEAAGGCWAASGEEDIPEKSAKKRLAYQTAAKASCDGKRKTAPIRGCWP